jgi:hypothetical protein
MDAYKALQEKDAQAKALQARRQRLSDLFAEESEQFRVSFSRVLCNFALCKDVYFSNTFFTLNRNFFLY